ncbi:MAG: FeoA family protein [Christensenellaceae bacterium]|jgi:ferrous iron transport protein A
MPLSMLRAGEQMTIRKIKGKDEAQKFMASLGFTVGSEVTVISEITGNIIVQIKDTRVAISKEMANRIYV